MANINLSGHFAAYRQWNGVRGEAVANTPYLRVRTYMLRLQLFLDDYKRTDTRQFDGPQS